MAVADRNRLEQEALLQLNKNSLDGALNAYLQILKLDPKDRRIRQKVGELYLKLNKPQEAVKHLKEVSDGLIKEGNHRAAVSVLKQLLAVVPEDPDLQMELGECYLAAGYPNDARTCFDQAMRLHIGLLAPARAAKAARRLAELSPGEPAVKLKVAELLEQANDPVGALAIYQDVIAEFRRRGRPDEVGRVAELALKLKPEEMGLVLEAAAARVESGEWKKALVHLQGMFKVAPHDPKVLELLSRAFEGSEQPEKALKVVMELVRIAADRRDAPMEAEALRRAVKLGADEPEIRARLATVEERLSRMQRRLSSLNLYQPWDDDLLRIQVRGEVLARYGFPDRAETELKAGLEKWPEALPLLATLAELLVDLGRLDEALPIIARMAPRAGAEERAVRERRAVLKGEELPPEVEEITNIEPELVEPDIDDEVVDDEVIDDEEGPSPEVIDDEDDDDVTNPRIGRSPLVEAEERGDKAAAVGDLAGALMAWREVLTLEPGNERILSKLSLIHI